MLDSRSCFHFLEIVLPLPTVTVSLWINYSHPDKRQPWAQIDIIQYRWTGCLCCEKTSGLGQELTCTRYTTHTDDGLSHSPPACPPHLGHFEKPAVWMINLLRQSAGVSTLRCWSYTSAVFACVSACTRLLKFIPFLLTNPIQNCRGKALVNTAYWSTLGLKAICRALGESIVAVGWTHMIKYKPVQIGTRAHWATSMCTFIHAYNICFVSSFLMTFITFQIDNKSKHGYLIMFKY